MEALELCHQHLELLLARIEDINAGDILLKKLHTKIEPRHHIDKAKMIGSIGDSLLSMFPIAEGARAVSND